MRQSGHIAICIEGDNDAAEILRLTCLEQELQIEKNFAQSPILRAEESGAVAALPNGTSK